MLCPECRAVLSGTVPCRVRPEPEPAGLPAVHAAARYADEVRAVLLAHKERGALTLAAPLGTALAGAVRAGLREAWAGGSAGDRGAVPGAGAGPGGAGWGSAGSGWGSEGAERGCRVVGPGWSGGGPVGAGGAFGGLTGGDGRRAAGAGRAGGVAGDGVVRLVPVPSARRVVGARGHDPARRIALAAAGELRRGGVAARVVGVLRQRRAVADQSGLDARGRLENLAGALAVVPGGGRMLLGGPVVLVDDLMTTGASLTEAARAVRAATAAEAVARGCDGGSVAYGSAVTAVYDTAAREGRGGRRNRSAEADMGGGPGMVRTYRAGDVICAAVVAASPGSFEINRN